ncbi:MAG: DUF484 family protein [Oceanococcaceae bacterium]
MSASAATKTIPAPDDVLEKRFLDYLRDHPDFFARHEEALSRMTLIHGAGTAASLLERHTARLRDRVGRLEHQLADLVEVARLNEVNARHLHGLAQDLLQAGDASVALQVLQDTMARDFDIEATRLVMMSGDDYAPQRSLAYQGDVPVQLADVMRTGMTACGPISAALRTDVFPDQPELQSCAIVPLDRQRRDAALILASGSSTQFVEGMGTYFLELTAGLLAAALAADHEQLDRR